MKPSFTSCTCIVVLLLTLANAAGAQITVSGCTGTGNGTYAALTTTTGGLFAKLNAVPGAYTAGDAIVVTVSGNTAEDGANALNTGTWASLSIKPGGGVTSTLSGNLAGAMISLSGADNVTIDGLNTGGNALIISNSSNSPLASTIRLNSDASGNTITNCTISGSAAGNTGSVIYFGSGSGGGNDNNTISNNTITAANGNLPYYLIYSSGNVSPNENSGNMISNNKLSDFFNSGANGGDAWAIYIASGNTGWTINGNSIYQTASRTPSTTMSGYVVVTGGIYIGSSGGGFSVTNNYIGGSDAGCSGPLWLIMGTNKANFFKGIYVASGVSASACSIQGNIITNIKVIANSAGGFTGITLAGGYLNAGTAKGNRIGTTTFSGSGSGGISFQQSSSSGARFTGILTTGYDYYNIQNDTVAGIALEIGGPSMLYTHFYGIRNASSPGALTISNNVIGSTTMANNIVSTQVQNASSTAVSFYGIAHEDGPAATISGNTVANMSYTASGSSGLYMAGIAISATNSSCTISDNKIYSLSSNAPAVLTTPASITGIRHEGSGAISITGNKVYALRNVNTGTGTYSVLGIYCANGYTGTPVISGNTVHSLSSAGSGLGTTQWGIRVDNGTSWTIANNMVRLGIDETGASVTGDYDIRCIDAGGATCNVYHNSAYIGGASGAGTSPTYAIATGGGNTIKNNIIANRRTNNNANTHVGLYFVTGSGGSQDYNLYWVDAQNGGVIGRSVSTNYPTLASLQASGRDAHSLSNNPQYLNATGNAQAVNLHLSTSVFTAAANCGVSGIGITTDFDGDDRCPAGGCPGAASAPDMGADEGNFIAAAATTGALSASAYCVGSAVSVPFTANGIFNSGNVFTAELSNASGSFASPITIGTLTGQTASPIAAIIPTNTPAGTGYRIRVNSSDYLSIGSDNGSNLTVNLLPTVSGVTGATSICSGTSTNLTASSAAGSAVYKWYDAASAGSLLYTGVTYTTANLSTNTPFYITVTDGNGCTSSPRTAATVTVNSATVPGAVSATPSAICAGGSSNLTATSAGNTISWYMTASGGTSLGSSSSGANFSAAPASTTTYYADAVTPDKTMLGNATYNAANNQTYTYGYDFTPSANITVTGLRSYFGGKISVWSTGNTSTPVISQTVSGTPTVWMVTPLSSPVTLTGGTTYRIAIYSSVLYFGGTLATSFSGGTIGNCYYDGADTYPYAQDGRRMIMVDLQFSGGGCASTSRTPVTLTVNNPSIDISGGGTALSITDGDLTPGSADGTAFGTGVFSRTFTIKNTGPCPLSISFSSSNASEFSITGAPGSVPAQSGATPGQATFTVRFVPSASGNRTATITVTNNSLSHPAYTFGVSGTGEAGAALNFDGVDDYVSLGTSTTLRPTSALSIEAWVYSADWTVTQPNKTLIGNTQNGGYALTLSAGGQMSALVQANGNYGSAIATISGLSAGWHHFAMTYDGQYRRLYIDGSEASSSDAGGNYAIGYGGAATPVILGGEASAGATPESNRYFAGTIDEVRIWNRALCPGEILYNMNGRLTNPATQSGLLLNYSMNQGIASGDNTGINTLTDASASSITGAMNNFAGTGSASNFVTSAVGTSVVATYLPPEINVRGNSQDIADGAGTPLSANHTHFGNGITSRTFTIQNTGSGPMSVTGVTITGANAGDFSLAASPVSSVAANGATTFTIGFNQSTAGIRKAVVHIANGDCDEADYDFAISGTGNKQYYVDLSATGGNDGSSWTAAFTSFQSALNLAVAGDTVFTAQGTYKPGIGIQPSPTTRTNTFTLSNGAVYFGGFPAGGGSSASRNFTNYRSILSGDIGTANVNTDNCFLVVNAVNLMASTVLNGFTIEGGRADSSGYTMYSRAGAINLGSTGAMQLESLTVRNNTANAAVNAEGPVAWSVQNCVFDNNGNAGAVYIGGTASGAFINCSFMNNTGFNGGAICQNVLSGTTFSFTGCSFTGNAGTYPGGGGAINAGNAANTFTNCSFTNNSSIGPGGALDKTYATTNTFSYCTFTGNSGRDGGALCSYSGGFNIDHCAFVQNFATGSSTTGASYGGAIHGSGTITNTVFRNNYTQYGTGGAIYDNVGAQPLNLTNCTFTGNNAGFSSVGGGVNNNSGPNINISNCIFWNNTANGSHPNASSEIVSYSGTLTVTNTIWQGNTSSGGTIYNADPLFTNAATGDLTLRDCSPALDSGAANSLTTDILGNPRPVDIFPGGKSNDIGAYERQTAPVLPEINVLGNSAGITDGSATATPGNHTDFGTGAFSRTFTIQNTGAAALSVSGVSITGANASDFSVTAAPAASIGGAGSDAFTISFSPSATGLRTATVHIANNDCNEGDYDFAVQGTGVAGATLSFDGVNDFVSASGIGIGSGPFTLEAWAQGNSGYLFGQGTAGLNAGLSAGFRNSTTVTFAFYGNDLDAAIPIDPAGWHHWAFAYNPGGNPKRVIYRDGVAIGSDNGAAYTGSGTLYLGAPAYTSAPFSGSMDEVRVWSRALCASEIVNNMGGSLPAPATQPGLLLYYDMNAGVASGNNSASGANVTAIMDVSGHGRNGALNNFLLKGAASNLVGSAVGAAAAPAYAGPDVPVLSSSAAVVCSGNTVVLSVASGALNNAAGWQWYSGACGGTPVGAGTSINVAPAATTTYYARGEGCVVPGGCGAITITVNPKPVATPAPAGQTVCSGAAIVPIVISGSISGTTYAWTRTNAAAVTGIAAGGSGNTISGTLSNLTSLPVTVTFSIIPSAMSGGMTCTGSAATATVEVPPALSAAAVAAPLYTVAGQKIQTVFLGYPGAPQADTLKVMPAGGTAPYAYVWTMSGCNVTTVNPSFSNTASSYAFAPVAADAPNGNGDNVYTFNIKVTDYNGCTATAVKRLNVVNPFRGDSMVVCHRIATRGSNTYQLLTVPAADGPGHVAHGDALGNCAAFSGRMGGEAAEVEAVAFAGDAEPVLSVYPNPSTGAFTVALSAVEVGADVVVTDVQGRVVAVRHVAAGGALRATFDLGGVGRGMYLVRVQDGARAFHAKLAVH